MIISRDNKQQKSNFAENDRESRNFKRGFGDFGDENKFNKSPRSEKFGRNRNDGEEFNRRPRDFEGRRDKDDGDFSSRKPRRSFEDRGDFRSGKRFDKEGDGNDRRDRDRDTRPPRFRSSDDRGFRSERDGFKPRGDRGDRDETYKGNRERSDRGFGERPERSDRGFGERPERSDRGFGERPERRDRGFGERPERRDRTERSSEDRPPRFERERSERSDRDRTERSFGERPPRDGFRDRERRSPRERDSDSNFAQKSFGDRERRDSKFPQRESESFEKTFKIEEDLSLGSEESAKTNFSSERRDKKRQYSERATKPSKINTEESNTTNDNSKSEDFIKPLSTNSFQKKERKPESPSISEIDMNKITLAQLKSKKESDITKLSESKKEELLNKEETVEYRDSKKDYLYGMHSVQAALTYNYRKNLELLIDQNFKENIPDHVQKILDLAKTKDAKVKYTSRDRLDKITGGRPHNGVVLKSDIRDYIYINNFAYLENNKFIPKGEGNLFILLDQIVDPQNFGSVIRSAVFLGADAILLNRKNRPPSSATVCKVSSGASECVDLFAIKSLRPFLKEAGEKGWTVITTSIEKEADVQMRLDGGSQVNSTNSNIKGNEQNESTEENAEKPVEDTVIVPKTVTLNELKLSNKSNVILVLGSEASGITSNLSGTVHYNLFIPPMLNPEETGKHPFTLIDSLNVGVSAGIIINHIKSELKNVHNISEGVKH